MPPAKPSEILKKIGHGCGHLGSSQFHGGGGRATGIQRSLKLECPKAHMGVRLGSKSCVEKTAKFAPEKVGISLAYQNGRSKSAGKPSHRAAPALNPDGFALLYVGANAEPERSWLV